jgi:gluconate 5-dehydrogenase
MPSLTNKTALVVGASRGIGLAIGRELAVAGARTILAARSMGVLERETMGLRASGLQAVPMQLDTANPAATAQLPDVDILVNVAGTNIRKQFVDYTQEEYDHLLQTNLTGIVQITRRVGERMIARGRGGKVIFIGSLMSMLGLPYLTIYSITKSALAGLTRSLAAEWGKHNIQVNCIAPGFILTDLNREMWQSPEMKHWLEGSQANPRMGTPADLAPLAVFLSGSGSDYITGQVIAVDGGYSTTANWPFTPV